ncbi:Arm DNA-binding domain-containing protein [Bacillus altitudinis]|uniref:Arm DNA-binding domain-containing protein n=1 Tax=Bacillus altitudinis TaxID=293387 RepID=UPI003F75B95E
MINVKPCTDNTFSYVIESLDRATGKRKRIIQKGFKTKEEAMKAAKLEELRIHGFSNTKAPL